MKNKIILSVLLGFTCLFGYKPQYINCHIYAQENIVYVSDLELALSLSKETKQEVLLIFSASWCQFCNKLKNDLSLLSNLDNKIICIIDSDEEKKLSRQFKVKTLPSSFLINSDGDIISNITGYDFNSYNRWLNK